MICGSESSGRAGGAAAFVAIAVAGFGALDASTFNLGEFCFGGSSLLANETPVNGYSNAQRDEIANNLNQCLNIYISSYQKFYAAMEEKSHCLWSLGTTIPKVSSQFIDPSFDLTSDPNTIDEITSHCYLGSSGLSSFCEEQMPLFDADENNENEDEDEEEYELRLIPIEYPIDGYIESESGCCYEIHDGHYKFMGVLNGTNEIEEGEDINELDGEKE